MSDWEIVDETSPGSDWEIISSMPEQKAHKEPESKFSWPRFLAEQMVGSGLDMTDFLASIMGQNLTAQLASNYQEGMEPAIPSHAIKELSKMGGLDLESQGEGETPAQRIIGKGVRMAPQFLNPAMAGSGALGTAKALGTGALAGLGSGTLQEGGVPGPLADIASIGTTVGVPALYKKLMAPHLTDAEKRVAKYAQNAMTESELEGARKALENPPEFPVSGYEPMTAEMMESPTMSQLHRQRYGVLGSGLPEKASTSEKILKNAMERARGEPASSERLQELVKGKREKAISERTEATKPGYEALEKMEEPLNPKHLKEFIKDSRYKGRVKSDLEKVKGYIKPSVELSAEEKQALKAYKAASPEERKLMEKPKGLYPETRELDEAKKSITADIESLGHKEKRRKKILGMAKAELEKDLEKVPLSKETATKYHELSKPVDEIVKHPHIKKIPDSKKNNLYKGLFSKNESQDNLRQLKSIFKDSPEEWREIQDGLFHYLENHISKGRELSYSKMKNFMEDHGKALAEVLDENQMKVIKELEKALGGKNIAWSEGIGKQTVTHEKLESGLGLREGLGFKAMEAASSLPQATKPLKFLLNRWNMNKKADTYAALDKMLKEPEFAKKLLTHKFANQNEFNKFMFTAIPPLSRSRKEEE